MRKSPTPRYLAALYTLGYLALTAAISPSAQGAGTESPKSEYLIKLSDWQRESNLFTIFFAADSALFPDDFAPIRHEPTYAGKQQYYGMVRWGYSRDTLEDDEYHVVLDIDEAGADRFYFDRNNNEDLADDGPPLTWVSDSAQEESRFVPLSTTFNYGFTETAHILYLEKPEQPQLSKANGREVLAYPLVTFSAKRGKWALPSDTFAIELYTMNACGRISENTGEWFIIDVNKNREFEFIPPDQRVLLATPDFDFGGNSWHAEVDSLGNAISVSLSHQPAKVTKDGETTRDPKYALRGVNMTAPGFALDDIDGNRVSLDSLAGKVVVINFWHTGCIPCRAEIPELNLLVAKYQNKDVVFLAPTFNDADLVTKFCKEIPFSYTLLPGANDMISDYQISAYPVHLILDKQGIVRYLKLGSSVHIAQSLSSAIDGLLRE